jgi:hypothetical protein
MMRLFDELRFSSQGVAFMKKTILVGLALVAVCLSHAPSSAAQTGGSPASMRESQSVNVVGTWLLVSETAHQGDKTTQPLGPNPAGSIMLDGGGRFMLLIARPGLPNFAANKRDAGTPEENKAVLAGLLAFIGTYSVSEGVLILHVEAGTFPNWNGTDQKRYLTLSNDQMLWTNRTPAIGAEVVEVVWKRAH